MATDNLGLVFQTESDKVDEAVEFNANYNLIDASVGDKPLAYQSELLDFGVDGWSLPLTSLSAPGAFTPAWDFVEGHSYYVKVGLLTKGGPGGRFFPRFKLVNSSCSVRTFAASWVPIVGEQRLKPVIAGVQPEDTAGDLKLCNYVPNGSDGAWSEATVETGDRTTYPALNPQNYYRALSFGPCNVSFTVPFSDCEVPPVAGVDGINAYATLVVPTAPTVASSAQYKVECKNASGSVIQTFTGTTTNIAAAGTYFLGDMNTSAIAAGTTSIKMTITVSEGAVFAPDSGCLFQIKSWGLHKLNGTTSWGTSYPNYTDKGFNNNTVRLPSQRYWDFVPDKINPSRTVAIQYAQVPTSWAFALGDLNLTIVEGIVTPQSGGPDPFSNGPILDMYRERLGSNVSLLKQWTTIEGL